MGKLLKIAISSLVFLIIITSTVTVASTNHSTAEPNNIETDHKTFVEQWNHAFSNSAFTSEQKKRLLKEVESLAKLLAQNYTELSGLLEQKGKVTGDALTTIEKRILLKEAERDLIVDAAEQTFGEFLSKSQANLIMMAGFHGVSQSHSGTGHLDVSHGGMNQKMNSTEQTAMDLSKLAERLNINCEAVSLKLIFEHLQKEVKTK